MRLQEPLDDRSRWSSTGNCAIEKAMTVVGTRTSMLIMREAFYGTTRFDDFVERVGMATGTASTHLAALTEAGLLQRRPYREPGGRKRDGYQLTQSGIDFLPVLVSLYQWGRKHTEVGHLVEFAHTDCGAPVSVDVRCTHGHPVADDSIELRPSAEC